MECPRCHHMLETYTRFCPACGRSVEDLDWSADEEDLGPDYEEDYEEDGDAAEDSGSGQSDGAEQQRDDEARGDDPRDGESHEEEPWEEATGEREPSEEGPCGGEPYEDQPYGEDPIGEGSYGGGAEAYEEVEAYEEDEAHEGADGDEYEEYDEYYDRHDALDDTNSFASPYSEFDSYENAEAYEKPTVRSVLSANWRKIVAVVACVLVVVLAGAFSLTWHDGQKAAEQAKADATLEELRATDDVSVAMQIEGYDSTHMTPVPVRVTGTAEAGEEVNKLVLLMPREDVLPLPQGVYMVSAGGSVLSDQGALYQASVDTFSVVVHGGEVTVNGAPQSTSKSPLVRFVYSRVELQDVTDAMLDAARAWMEQTGVVNVNNYIDVIIARRQEVFDRLDAEQAAREEADQQAAEDAQKAAAELEQKRQERLQKEKELEERQKSKTGQSTKTSQEDDEDEDGQGTNSRQTTSSSNATSAYDDSDDTSYGTNGEYDPYGSSGYAYDPYAYGGGDDY